MPTRHVLASTLLATIAILPACSGSSDSSQFPGVTPEAGSPIPTDAGVNLGTGSGDANDGPCAPAALPAQFAPTWKGPAASASGACSESQIQGFYDACLASGVSASTCSSFTSANSACSSCLQSNDTDAKYGAVIWHASHSYYTINVAGCIADVQNDLSATSCAAAYQAVLQCEETACTQCYDPANGDFTRYANCESNAGSECAKYQTAESSACGDELKDAASPASACRPAPGSTGEDAYLLVAPVLCGENG